MDYKKEVIEKAIEIINEKDDRSKFIINFVLDKDNTEKKTFCNQSL